MLVALVPGALCCGAEAGVEDRDVLRPRDREIEVQRRPPDLPLRLDPQYRLPPLARCRNRHRSWVRHDPGERGGSADDLAFSPSGTTTATVGRDGSVRVWDVAFTADLLTAACGIAKVSLTRQQRADYAETQPFSRSAPQGSQ